MTTIDFARLIKDAKGASMEALPVGDYDVEVSKSEATTSSNGKPMIKVTMRVTAGPYEKRTVLNQFVMSQDNPVALSIFFRHMKAFGLTEEWFVSLGSNGSLEPVANALLNRRARLTLGHRQWQGETRNEVKAVKPYTGAPTPAPTGPATAVAGPIAPTAAPIAPPAPLVAAPIAAPPTPPAPPAPAAAPQPVAAPAAASVVPMPTPPAPPEVPAVPTTAAATPASTSPVESTASSTPTPVAATSEPTPPPPAVPGTQDLPF